jgi:hypothetical protein
MPQVATALPEVQEADRQGSADGAGDGRRFQSVENGLFPSADSLFLAIDFLDFKQHPSAFVCGIKERVPLPRRTGDELHTRLREWVWYRMWDKRGTFPSLFLWTIHHATLQTRTKPSPASRRVSPPLRRQYACTHSASALLSQS